MNVNAIGLGSLGPQMSATASEGTRSMPPPPPGGAQGGGFASAIGEALQSLGISEVPEAEREAVGKAIGSFMQELMGALHQQGAQPPQEPEGSGGPGRLAEDLQSLISSLQGEDGAASGLESSFTALLDTLGVESSDARSKLANFLQTLADKSPQAGNSGNLVNTSV